MLKKILLEILDVVVPRFITEEVAVLKDNNGEFVVLCRTEELNQGEFFSFKTSCRSFNFFGFALFPKIEIPEKHL